METASPVPVPATAKPPRSEPPIPEVTDFPAQIRKGLISVIIVNYNAGRYLADAVASVVASRIPHEIIVVDNDSTDDSLSRLPDSEHHALQIVRLGDNTGFANACNEGIRLAEGEFLALINPDCRVYPGALAALKGMLEKDPSAGMVGPRVVNPDGSEQRGARRDIPNPWRIFCTTLGLHRLMPEHPRFRDFNRNADPLPEKSTAVQAISGACMMVRRNALASVGMMDGDYFMHFEDLDWCLRFTAAGWRIVFVPHAVVEHTQGVCSRRAPFRVAYAKHRSLVRFLRKHFTRYYPSSFMTLVTGIVMARFILVGAGIAWRRSLGALHLGGAKSPAARSN
mgnify:CR=1 FL=1|tara:strand:+ start:233 stop:1249 length:1017 start_codon:yes stop_codon:yes gene_type:complete